MGQDLLELLDAADLYPPAFDASLSWSEDAPPATFGLSLVRADACPDCPDSPDGKHHEEDDDATECYHCGEKRFTQPVATPPAPPAAKTLRAHIEGVDGIARAVEELDNADLTDEEAATLAELLIGAIAGTKRKVDDTARVLAMFEHLEQAAICERERLAKRAKFFERQAQRLTDYVLATMEASKLPKLEGETSTLARKLNPPKVVIADGAVFGHEFLRYPDAPPPEPDKDALKKALKGGRKIAGAELRQTARLVRS